MTVEQFLSHFINLFEFSIEISINGYVVEYTDYQYGKNNLNKYLKYQIESWNIDCFNEEIKLELKEETQEEN